jgi:hypothetical protein
MATASGSDPLQRTAPRSALEQAKQAGKEQAGALWNDAKDTARSALDDQKHAAAGTLHDFAGVLRNASRQLEDDRHSSVSRLAESAADGFERVSRLLRTRDLESMAGEAERFARNQPVAFFGAALALGFLAMRFAKASRQEPSASECVSSGRERGATSSYPLAEPLGGSETAGTNVPPYTPV